MLSKNKGNAILSYNSIIFVINFIFLFFLWNFIFDSSSAFNIMLSNQNALLIFMVISTIAIVIQQIIYELGHYILGKLSGYSFAYISMFNTILMYNNKRFISRVQPSFVFGFRCVMMPKSENAPFILYNLSGEIATIILSIACYGLSFFIHGNPYLYITLILICVYGLYSVVYNIIPTMKKGKLNTGYTTLLMLKNEQVRRARNIYLMIEGLSINGVSFSDMPSKYFEVPDNTVLDNPIICKTVYSSALFHEYMKNFTLAKELYSRLLECENLNGNYNNEIVCELLFIELLGDCRPDIVDDLYRKVNSFIESTKKYIVTDRVMYAYYSLYKKDAAKANEAFANFEQNKMYYPFPGDIKNETELMELVKNKSRTF